ncbi:MAG: hypothetical protein QOH13_927 [Thermoleophilaceae bacterium]|nr:hypothetical protein [Thermoleophilaceae bacterium]
MRALALERRPVGFIHGMGGKRREKRRAVIPEPAPLPHRRSTVAGLGGPAGRGSALPLVYVAFSPRYRERQTDHHRSTALLMMIQRQPLLG